MTPAQDMLTTIAQELEIPEERLLKQGLRSVLEHELREIKAAIFEIHGRYKIADVAEMEARYQDGTLEEADSWRDFQRLDHLEYKRDRLRHLLSTIG